jgi:hypothetical protein
VKRLCVSLPLCLQVEGAGGAQAAEVRQEVSEEQEGEEVSEEQEGEEEEEEEEGDAEPMDVEGQPTTAWSNAADNSGRGGGDAAAGSESDAAAMESESDLEVVD